MAFAPFKNFMPRGLYARALLILLLPVVVVQLVVSVVFVQRHFEDVTVQMSDTIARELRLVLDAIASAPNEVRVEDALSFVTAPLKFEVAPVTTEALTAPNLRTWYDFSGRVIIARLSEVVPEIRSFDLLNDDVVRVAMVSPKGPLAVTFNRKRISAKNPHQLLVNMVFFSILVTAIAYNYMRNQLRPIKRLARAALAFGRGQHTAYTPAGATEVRAAGTAFVDMRNRIERQIETRTLLLSGISHDLRTPLTRMRLGLAMLESGDREPLEQDVDDMERMIDAFLDFAKGEGEGEPEIVDPIVMTRDLVSNAQRGKQSVTLLEASGAGTVTLRPMAMRRALDNLISNGVRYGDRVEVSVALTDKSLRFRVEDDGPGIPKDLRSDAQRPFTRLDPARNQDKGSGVGLGLAIATDIARSHGGVLRLGRSERLGGLRADIVIAR